MIAISKDNNVVTLINVFTVEPQNQQRLFLPVEAFYWLEPNYGYDAIG
jgi:hypothetical protein